MSVPAVVLTELDGAIGVLPSGVKILAMAGVSDSGPTDTPATFARTQDVVSTFGEGPLVEAAAYWIENYNRPVLLVRTGETVVATNDAIDVIGVTGTSVVTDTGTVANDDLDLQFIVVVGGTIASPGITYRESTDEGRNLSGILSLGVATSVVISGSGGAGFDFAAGTLVAGDIVKMRVNAPNWDSTEIGAAITALKNSAVSWDLLEIVGPIDATTFDAIETGFGSLPERAWMGGVRVPTAAETEAAYLTSLSTAFDPKATVVGMLCAGAAKITSGVSFKKFRRQTSHDIAALQASVSEEIDIAAIDLGAIRGVSIRDANGNADEHDELINPGLDDARFTVHRTHLDENGVYVNNPNVFSASGSDFEFMQHRRVLNIAKTALRGFFARRLSKAIVVDKDTGFILESEAVEIESGAEAIMRSVLRTVPKASAIAFTLSRTDNLLSTKTLNGQASVTPLAYPKAINIDIGFKNPALQVVAQ